jgi:hypothetical protein
MSGAIPPLPQYAFMTGAQLKHRDNFTLSSVATWRTSLSVMPVLLSGHFTAKEKFQELKLE